VGGAEKASLTPSKRPLSFIVDGRLLLLRGGMTNPDTVIVVDVSRIAVVDLFIM
jgi:hypothetical protein